MEIKSICYKTIISQESKDAPNITITSDEENVEITLNACRMFNTLLNIETIIAALDKECYQLCKKHLLAQARKENERRRHQ